MRKFLPFLFISSLFSVGIILMNQNMANSNTGGPGGGYSGAPNENTCRTCHSGASLNGGLAIDSISSNIPSTGFVGGETYTITAHINQPTGASKFGFQISAENSSNSNIGSWVITNSTTTKIVNSNYVTHKSGGTSGSGGRSWSMNWKAPCAGQDTVIFYACFNVTNSNGQNSGDTIYTEVRGYSENVVNVADTIDNLAASDFGNNYDGRDLRVTFRTSPCETRTQEYRLMAVKQAQAGSWTISDAQAVSSSNYVVVNTGTPNTNKSRIFGMNGTDTDGDPIQNNEPYTVFLLSVGNSALVSNDTMFESNSITLTSPMVTVDSISGADIGNTGNASDLEAYFHTPADEVPVGEYRTIIVKESAAANFTKSDADMLASNLYKTTSPGSASTKISVSYQAGDMDSDGDTLEPNVDYRVFVFTKADGQVSLEDTLQQSDSTVSFDEPVGIAEREWGEEVSIRSFDGQLIISLPDNLNSAVSYRIYSLNGQILTEGLFRNRVNTIELGDEIPEIGIIQLTSEVFVISKKFVK